MSVEDDMGTGVGVETCFHHPDRPTGRHCTRCGRPACPECLRQAAVGSHCFECVQASAPPRREAARIRRTLAGHPMWATKALLAVNVAIYVIASATAGGTEPGDSLYLDYALYAGGVDVAGEWWRIVTSGFLHWDLFHLGMNMLALWVMGRLLEPALGTPRFVLVYAAGLLGGSAGALLLADPLTLTAGASGAIFGLFGALFLGLRARGVNPFETGIGGLLVLNLLITFLIPGISIGGHVGGLLVGGLAGWVFLRPAAERQVGASYVAAVAIAALTWLAALEAASWAVANA